MFSQLQRARLLLLGEKEWAYFLVTYLMTIMATYLTGVWELSIIHASQIMNLYSGTVVILWVVTNNTLRCTRDLAFPLFISKLAFVLGLVMLTISASGTCKEDESLCISTTKRILFYIALFMLALAVSAHETWTKKYLSTVNRPQDLAFFPRTTRKSAYILFPGGAFIAIGYISPWWIKFLIPTIFAGLFFFKAPIFSDDTTNEDPNDEKEAAYHEIGEVCSTLFAVYVCISSILVCFVFTVGNTFFILQATDLSPKLWFVTIAIVVLPAIKEFVKMVSCHVDHPWGLGASMIFTTLCCITAAKVETRRLGVVISEGVVDDSETIIPMTIFWLVPQYVLLGLAENSLDGHIEHGLKKVMANSQVMGIIIKAAGFYCGVFSVYAVEMLKPSWIQDTVNTSQLDNYYWLLATLSAINLLLFVLITVITALWLLSKEKRTSIVA